MNLIHFDSTPVCFFWYEFNNKFEIEKLFPSYAPDIVYHEEPFSTGTVKKNKDMVLCYDFKLKRMYTFKQINDSTLVALKHTAVFAKGDKLHKVREVTYDTP